MLLCMGVLFFLSHQPGSDSGPLLFSGEDKLMHMAAYGALSVTVILGFSAEFRAQHRWLVLTAGIVVPACFGISDEYHQSFITGRSSEFLDVVADMAGALLVSALWFFKSAEK